MEDLFVGRVRWDLLQPFPAQSPEDREVGDEVLTELAELLRARSDPTEIDLTGALPDGLLEALAKSGYLALSASPAAGGRGLSTMNTFRVISAAASWSNAIALTMGVSNGLGSTAYLPLLPDGPLRDLITARAPALVSGGADTEPSGAGNLLRSTTATPIEDGRAYLLNGEKIFISNAPVAGLMDVSATVTEPGGAPTVGLFFVDLDAPGVERGPRQNFLGFHGSPSGVLRLRDVRVPREHTVGLADEGWRSVTTLSALNARARMYIIAAPALAATKLCLAWSIGFVNRRFADGMPLHHYDQIQSLVTATSADLYALEALVRWCLLADVDTRLEQIAAKNITSRTAWQVVDRTMSLLGGEGLETAQSKANRGAAPVPLERLLRDIRGLRIAGGVDFQVDHWTAQSGLFARHYAESFTDSAPALVGAIDPGMIRRHAAQLRFVAAQARRWAVTAAGYAHGHPDPEELYAKAWVPITMNQIGAQLLMISLVLARATGDVDNPQAADLADLYCTRARTRLSELWRQLRDSGQPRRQRLMATIRADTAMPDDIIDPGGS